MHDDHTRVLRFARDGEGYESRMHDAETPRWLSDWIAQLEQAGALDAPASHEDRSMRAVAGALVRGEWLTIPFGSSRRSDR